MPFITSTTSTARPIIIPIKLSISAPDLISSPLSLYIQGLPVSPDSEFESASQTCLLSEFLQTAIYFEKQPDVFPEMLTYLLLSHLNQMLMHTHLFLIQDRDTDPSEFLH